MLKEHSSLYLCEILGAKCVWGRCGEAVLIKAWCTLKTSQPPVELDETCGCGPWWHFLTQLTNPLQNSASSLQGSSALKAVFPEEVGTAPKRKLTQGHTGTQQSWVYCKLLWSVAVSLHFLLSRWVLLFYKEKWRQATAINHNSRQVGWEIHDPQHLSEDKTSPKPLSIPSSSLSECFCDPSYHRTQVHYRFITACNFLF